MLKIGITGGIGSGKSFICRIFEVLEVEIYSADDRAKFLMDTDPELIQNISRILGHDVYSQNKLNRILVAQRIFTNKELLEKLNSVVHPVVAMDFNNWCKTRIKFPYVLHEAAILFESGFNRMLDKTIVVTASMDLRIQRVINRDKTDINTIKARINNQLPQEKLMQLADYIIENDNKNLILPQLIKIDQELKEL